MKHNETQSHSKNKVRDSEKDFGSRLLHTCFVVENFGSNGTFIAIRNAWRLLKFKVLRNITFGRIFDSRYC